MFKASVVNSTTQNVKKNLGWNILLTISGYLFPMLTFPYVTRILGPANLGTVNFTLSVVDFAILFSTLGMWSVGIRYISQFSDDPAKRSNVFSNLVSIHLVLSFIIAVVYVSLVVILPNLSEYRKLLFVGTSKIILGVFLVEWLFEGMQDFRYVTLRTLAIRMLYVLSVFLFVRDSNDYDIYFYETIAMTFVNAIVNWRYAHNYVTFKFSLSGSKMYLFPLFSMGLNGILLSFYNTFNVLFLGLVSGNASVGYFTTATKLYAIILSVISAYNNVFIPYQNSIFARGEYEKFSSSISKSMAIVCKLSIPVIIGSVIVAPELIWVIAGPGYEKAILPFRIIMVQVFFVGCDQILENQILLTYKKFKNILTCTVITTALSALILFLFVPIYGEIAAAVAVAIPHIAEFVLLYYYSHKCISFEFTFKGCIINILYCIPIAVICYFCQHLFTNQLLILVVSFFVSVIYYILIQLFVVKDKDLLNVIHRKINKGK